MNMYKKKESEGAGMAQKLYECIGEKLCMATGDGQNQVNMYKRSESESSGMVQKLKIVTAQNPAWPLGKKQN